jgi:hypothetical protein
MAPKPPSNFRQHLATAWLLANGALIVLWRPPGLSPFLLVGSPIIMLALLAWPIVAIVLVLSAIRWPVPPRRRVLAVATAMCGSVVGWQTMWLGPMFHVWWHQDAYLERARAALADPPPPSGFDVRVDHSDTPPVRVAFFWFAAHGDVEGIVYDPTGLVESRPRVWIHHAHLRHLFGPWYRF